LPYFSSLVVKTHPEYRAIDVEERRRRITSLSPFVIIVVAFPLPNVSAPASRVLILGGRFLPTIFGDVAQ
jgi:hypothetical protein